jgi:hypothetical protein
LYRRSSKFFNPFKADCDNRISMRQITRHSAENGLGKNFVQFGGFFSDRVNGDARVTLKAVKWPRFGSSTVAKLNRPLPACYRTRAAVFRTWPHGLASMGQVQMLFVSAWKQTWTTPVHGMDRSGSDHGPTWSGRSAAMVRVGFRTGPKVRTNC